MKIYAIRHGLTELNKKGLINGHIPDELAPEGIEQAKNAIKSLPTSIKHIYSSSLNRAKQTAEILNSQLRLPVSLHEELKEVCFGKLEGTPFLEEHKYDHINLKYDWRPSGENYDDVKNRVIKILQEIKSENKDGEALIVVHGGIIRMLLFLESGEVKGKIGNAELFCFDIDKILAKTN